HAQAAAANIAMLAAISSHRAETVDGAAFRFSPAGSCWALLCGIRSLSYVSPAVATFMLIVQAGEESFTGFTQGESIMSQFVRICSASEVPGEGEVAEFTVAGRALCVARI